MYVEGRKEGRKESEMNGSFVRELLMIFLFFLFFLFWFVYIRASRGVLRVPTSMGCIQVSTLFPGW